MRSVASLFGLLVTLAITTIVPGVWARTPLPPAPWGDPHSSYLGVHIDDVTPDRAAALKLKDPNGAVITDLDQDGPACKAGLRENDVIIIFNGSKVANPGELANLIHATPAGQTVPMSVMRDGQKKDVQVTLGSQGQIEARAIANERPRVAMHPMPYPGMMAPDIDVPSFNPLSARHGMVVESLSPQLCEYFGVPKGRGVLLRSVEKGSTAETAGLRAGDIIVKVNGEDVHDIADWRRSLHGHSGKTSITFFREKREQTVEMILPAPASNSKLEDFEWDGFNQKDFENAMQAFQQQMERLGPELARSQKEIMASIKPNQKELEKMQRDVQESMKLSEKDIERMTRDIQKSVPNAKQMAEMRSQIEQLEKSMPSQKQIEEMRRQVEDSMKNFSPQVQQQLEQLRKQMEQFKIEIPETDSESTREF